MSRNFVGELLIFLLFFIGSLDTKVLSNTLSLGDGSVFEVKLTNLHDTVPYMKQASIAANSKVTFNVTNVSSSASFIIFQIHIYQHNVTLSFDKDYLNKVSNRSIFGSNIGLLFKLTADTTQLFVKNDNVHNVTALLVVIAYNNNAPIPGGCNMEFNTEIAPYARIQTRDTMVIVDVQPASLSFNSSCENVSVEVEMYQMFLHEQDFTAETYFMGIVNMLTVQDIKNNGAKVMTSIVFSPMRRIFSAYIGVGSVYAAVASYENYSAAYVPIFSYGCNPAIDPVSCDILSGSVLKFISAVCFFLGLFFTFLGHRVSRIEKMFPIFFMGTVIGYAMQGSVTTGLAIGLLFNLLSLICPYSADRPYSVLFVNTTLGLFFACVAYLYSPGSFTFLQNNEVFWILFATLALSITLVATFSHSFSHVTCSIFSSFAIILPIDYWVGSSLKYIVINIVRRATVEDFNLAIVQPPIQSKDIWLIVFWIYLAVYHFYKHWKNRESLNPTETMTERTPLRNQIDVPDKLITTNRIPDITTTSRISNITTTDRIPDIITNYRVYHSLYTRIRFWRHGSVIDRRHFVM